MMNHKLSLLPFFCAFLLLTSSCSNEEKNNELKAADDQAVQTMVAEKYALLDIAVSEACNEKVTAAAYAVLDSIRNARAAKRAAKPMSKPKPRPKPRPKPAESQPKSNGSNNMYENEGKGVFASPKGENIGQPNGSNNLPDNDGTGIFASPKGENIGQPKDDNISPAQRARAEAERMRREAEQRAQDEANKPETDLPVKKPAKSNTHKAVDAHPNDNDENKNNSSPAAEEPKKETAKPVNTAELDRGTIVYTYPDTMLVNKSHTVTAAITKNGVELQIVAQELMEEVKDGLPESTPEVLPKKVAKQIPVGKWMKLSLEEAMNGVDTFFVVKPQQSDIQELADSVTYWRWEVKPLLQGKRKLVMKAFIITKDTTGTMAENSTKVYESTNIYVSSYPFWWADSVISWLWKNAHYIIFSLLIPGIGYVIKQKFFSGKEEEKAE